MLLYLVLTQINERYYNLKTVLCKLIHDKIEIIFEYKLYINYKITKRYLRNLTKI